MDNEITMGQILILLVFASGFLFTPVAGISEKPPEEGGLLPSSNSGGRTEDKRLIQNIRADSSMNSAKTNMFTRSSLLRRITDSDTEEKNLIRLFEFIFGETTGRNIYIFYEDERSSVVSASVPMCYQRGAEVTLYRCDEALRHLQKIIKDFNKLESVRNMFLLCSPAHLLLMFQKIREKVLESPVTHWFVILQEDVLEGIMAAMREGTQVTFALKAAEGLYDLMTSYINTNNDLALHEAGYWLWNETSGAAKFHLKKPLYRPVIEVYSDFLGRKLISSVTGTNLPFWTLEYLEDGSVKPVAGLDFRALTTVGEELNFTFEMQLSPDRAWGGVLLNGSVTGMVGAVHRHEAHLAMNEFSITGQREKAIDFTNAYYLEAVTLITPAAKKKLRVYAVFTSFTYEVWILLILVTLLIGPLVQFFIWARKRLLDEELENWDSLSDITFNMFRFLMIQGSKVPTSGWFYREVFIAWFFFCTLMISLYADVLIAVLAVPSYEKPIDSLYDLKDAIDSRGFISILGCNSNNEFLYSSTNQKKYKDVWDRFDREKGCVKTWDEGMDKVLTGDYALTNNRLGALVRANLRGREKFHFAKHEFYEHGYGIACPNGSPYKTAFESVLIRLMSSGLIIKYTNDELMKARKKDESGGGALEPFSILHLQAAFFLVLAGYLLGAIALFFERIVSSFSSEDSPMGLYS